MTTPDELLPLVDHILKLVGEDGAALERWSQTADGQKVIQYVVQIGKYNTNVGEGRDISIGDRLDRKLLEEIRDSLRSQLPSPPLEIDWPQVSRTLLEERLQLTTNPMTRGEDIDYQVEQVYVPLGLIERKKVPRRKQDVAPEQGSALYQEDWQPERSPENSKSSREAEPEQAIEITQRFEHGQFLEQVLLQGQSRKSQGKRIAVIGEPGAGKTTLLQQIARWAAATFPDSIVIWVSLADLSQTKLKEYIFETWLTAVVEQCDRSQASDSIKDALIQQCNQGRVWLLLDGLDEMPVSGNPLTEIQRQLQEGGWLQQARILLTCRLNLWDGDRNSLTQFDTYRTLEFAYPDQVEQFIRQWFAPRSKAELGEALCAALKESGKERIRDLVKNPLRLTLLCFNWYLQQGQLPETQAELYQRFVDRIYAWKQEQFPTTLAQREQLNQALAKLSLAAIDDTDSQRQTRFRLRQSFVSRFLQQSAPGETQTLLDLAEEIGWLNLIGVDANDPSEKVYAFYHPTFEEYFAALGIDDGRFFLNPGPRNPMAKEASYRIFDPQWRQVFLLWLGRKDVDKAQKDGLIGSMLKFKDGCGGFYSDRACLLAAVGIAEFKDCTYADAIVNQLVQWEFGHANWLKQGWAKLVAPTRVKARADWATTTFSQTDSQRVIRAVVRVLETTQDEDTRSSVAGSLGNIDPGNETAIRALVQVLETTQDEATLWIAAERLVKIGTGNETAIRELGRVLATTQDENISRKAAESLGEIDPGNETAIRELGRVLATAQDENIRWKAAESLGNIATGNETAIRELVRVLATTQDEDTRFIAAERLGNIATGNETAIRELVRVLVTTQDEDTRRSVAWSLGNIATGNETAIRELVRVLATTQDEDTRRSVAWSLGNIATGNETAIRELVRVLATTQNEDTRWSVVNSLGNIATGNETAIRALGRVLVTTQDENTCGIAAWSLGTIDPGNETAIQVLAQVLKTTQDEDTRRRAATSLDTIDPGNETAIRVLAQVLATTQNEDICRSAAWSLGNIATRNETAIRELVRVLETTQTESIYWRVVISLGSISTGNEMTIRELVRVLKTTQAESTRWSAAEILGKIATGNETAIRELVRVLATTQNESTRRRAADSLGSIGMGNETVIRALGRVLATTQNESTRRSAAESLGKIGMNSEETIRGFVRSLRRHLREEEAYQLMIKCAETLSYPKFFQAFHSRR
jgi:HEAT repeat protein/energy-coupling factor transporter ATP-binding protein EcfA2